ncbi:hypothetical protein LAZ67_15003022 [Cordylochernes scorpioides]|uniref:Uncharacterized protein n=1 Tax=Cordylochernes scorpioides TaxID=51811 RepID=A0ABY6LES2_9ARAC|nr:hypothetical protein LAZ67_15003022 [Cordylochernes scorpioides]
MTKADAFYFRDKKEEEDKRGYGIGEFTKQVFKLERTKIKTFGKALEIILRLQGRSHARFSFHGATTGERVHLRTPFCNSFFHGEKLNCRQYSSQFSVSVW